MSDQNVAEQGEESVPHQQNFIYTLQTLLYRNRSFIEISNKKKHHHKLSKPGKRNQKLIPS